MQLSRYLPRRKYACSRASSPQTQPATASHDARDVDRSSALLNGASLEVENKQITDIVDELVNSAEVSVSGGSDTETSKADPSKHFDDKSHVRNSSAVKRPQSFKSVSVNRTFLASKAATSSTLRTDSSAGSTSAMSQSTPSNSASRLKLVAKSGSSLGGSTKTLSTNGKPATAPDPNTVWNRNRPVTQPEQKKLSDEELMHKYGIHMAGRLGPEDTKGQSNWADIDDDEEWAPETITWTDGTKITLPQADESSSNPTPPHAALSKEASPAPPKSKSPAPTASATASPPVKPGTLASAKSLVLKGAPEKPTLVAKPPAPPTPAKSPWARLPPVDKIPPGQMEVFAPASVPRLPLRDPVAAQGPPPPPAKEIAADDFSRSGFREGNSSNHSQLYNSQSGRYEPVADRKGSRGDIHSRQPAVLQRPHHEQQGPAEPSAAFQTSRTGGHEVPYGRRRGSSNVSGSSGMLAHKLGKPHDILPPTEFLQSRSASVATAGAESPLSARTFSPIDNQHTPRFQPSHPYQPRPSPGQAYATPYHNLTAPDAVPLEDDYEIQKRVMRDRREQAIKRRLEEEAREEEARKARIAEKLKAMGPAPERRSAKKEEKKEESPAPPVHAPREGIPAANSGSTSEPQPEPEQSAPRTVGSIGRENLGASSQINGDARRPLGEAERSRTSTAHTTTAPKAQPPAHWPDTPQHPERFTTWGNGPQNTSRNVWGAPGNDRSLGNGTFNPDLGTLPDSHPAPISERNHRPAPIGPPRTTSQPPVRPEAIPGNRLAPIGPPRTRGPEPTGLGAWQTYDPVEDDRRIALEIQESRKTRGEPAPIAVKDTWRAVDLNESGKRTVAGPSFKTHGEAPSDISDRPDGTHSERKGLGSSEFYRPRADVSRNETNGARSEFSRQPSVGHTAGAVPGPANQARSSSRFFPARDAPPHDYSRIQEPIVRTKSPTPPPPTADGHPVFDGDVTRPHVALPPARPIVKLPPSNSAAPTPVIPPAKPVPASFAAAAAAASASSRPPQQPTAPRPSSRGKGYGGIPQKPHEIASQENWQDKINSLMGKKSTPPARSMAVDSSSRIALDYTQQSYDPATVALPSLSHSVSSIATEDSDYTSREMAEECFGEQEMGSLPAVKLPSEAPDALWQAVEPDFDPVPAKLRVDPTGAESFRFPHEILNGKSVIRISAPGMPEVKTVPISFANSNRSFSNPRRSGPRVNPRRLSNRGGQRGGREHPDHVNEHASSSSPGRPPPSRNGRGYRPRAENWGRHPSSTSAAQS
ncbi:hypothetical protein GGS23DRAFT_141415 [Durotheca rogersii]|uniref:uncharacterized protein n=1 Tax=Durotheca rogersii TaxID=419775 RepID=UPI00221E9C7A|nr:uncharacterized protein GGS23DRAFT_141415 [Durotheca rogersii]KAI5861605.1 hypothetical protein GGS23DRAFT_141415 [Durotheca rogersii]